MKTHVEWNYRGRKPTRRRLLERVIVFCAISAARGATARSKKPWAVLRNAKRFPLRVTARKHFIVLADEHSVPTIKCSLRTQCRRKYAARTHMWYSSSQCAQKERNESDARNLRFHVWKFEKLVALGEMRGCGRKLALCLAVDRMRQIGWFRSPPFVLIAPSKQTLICAQALITHLTHSMVAFLLVSAGRNVKIRRD